LYTGKALSLSFPKINKFILNKNKDIRPNESIDIFVEAEGQDALEYSYKTSTAFEGILQYYVNEWVEIEVETEGSKAKIRAPDKEGIYRVYCFVKDKRGNVTSSNSSISVSKQ
jgi:hypothetical protein